MTMMTEDTEIEIKQILMNNGEPRFIEFFSPSDTRTHIMDCERFMELFRYSVDEFKEKAKR